MSTTVEPNEATSTPDYTPDSRSVESKAENPTRSFVADESFAREPTEADAWDKEIQEDAKAGKLNALLEEARKEHRNETTQSLP